MYWARGAKPHLKGKETKQKGMCLLGWANFSKSSQIEPLFLYSMCMGEIRSHAKFQVPSPSGPVRAGQLVRNFSDFDFFHGNGSHLLISWNFYTRPTPFDR